MFSWRKKSPNTCSERDVRFFFLLCLGREVEHAGQSNKRVGSRPFGVCKSLLGSVEFARNMLEPLALGKSPLWKPYGADAQLVLKEGFKTHFDARNGTPPNSWAEAICLLSNNARFLQIFDAAGTGYDARWLQERLLNIGDEKPRRIVGAIEEITSTSIRGFALDADDPTLPVTLDFYVNDAFIGQQTPSQPRPDLQEKYGGDGKVAFSHDYSIPEHLRDFNQLVVMVFDHSSGQPVCPAKEFAPIRARHITDTARLADEVSLLRHQMQGDDASADVLGQLDRIEAALPQINKALSYPLGDYAGYRQQYPVPSAPAPKEGTVMPSVAVCYLDDTLSLANIPDAYSLSTLVECKADYIVFVEASAGINKEACGWIAHAAYKNPDSVILYADYELADGDALLPCCRARFDAELLLQDPSYAQAFAVRRDYAHKLVVGPAASFTLWLNVLGAEGAAAFHHIPKILWNYKALPAPGYNDLRKAITTYFSGQGISASAAPHSDTYGGALEDKLTVDWPIDATLPKLAIIIPTRDQLNLVRDCVTSLQKTLKYPAATEIIIVDNGSADADMLDWLAEQKANNKVRVIRHNAAFNWAELNNVAAAQSDADYLLFLNDDTKALDKDWDHILRGYLARSDVGVIGARLLYEDGSVQHGGVTINQLDFVASDAIVHEAHGQSPSLGGYMRRSQLCHTSSAVTGAFLACKRLDFEAASGFDAENFAVTFNDIDFCLRLAELDKKTLYVPAITMLHFESKSRGYDSVTSEKAERVQREHKMMIEKWNKIGFTDEWYSPTFFRGSNPYETLAAPGMLSKSGQP